MPSSKESIISVQQLLQVTHHRNKNQHRLSKWYKAFSILRHQIAKLINELETLETAELYSSTGMKGEEESKYVTVAKEKVEKRARFLRQWVLEDCYLAFSNLVADNQYSALGLVLLGCLARVKSVIRQFIEDEKVDGADSDAEGGGDVVMELTTGENERQVDLGEVVDRREILGNLEGPLDDDKVTGNEQEMLEEQIAPEATEETQRVTISKQAKKKRMGPLVDRDESLTRETATPSKPPKKRRKRGDAFDDLFSGLI